MKITNDIFYVGVNDHTLDLFEGQYRVPNGMSYNSYVILDERIAVLDTVDARFGQQWLTNLQACLGERTPDYLVVHHMEPDHSSNITAFMQAYPSAVVVSADKSFWMMQQFFGDEYAERRLIVKEGDTLSLGKHALTFVSAPMVHWPEVMVSYDACDRVLFSADAFGKFGALDADEPWLDEARRYYIGIVGKYGVQVQKLLQKAATLTIDMICPLHGPVLRENIADYLQKYHLWSSYTPERKGVLIAYTSVYGNTQAAVKLLEAQLREAGCENVIVRDLARCDHSEVVAEAFCYDRMVLATTTYNGDIFPFMREFIHELTERGYQRRRIGIMENGTWAPIAAKKLRAMLECSKELTFVEPTVTLRSAMTEQSREDIAALAAQLC